MKPEWAYDKSRRAVFDLGRRDDWGLNPIVAAAVAPEDGRLIEAAPRMLAALRALRYPDFACMCYEGSDPCAVCQAEEILAHIDGAKG